MKARKPRGPVHSGPADHVVGDAAAAAAGGGSGTTPSSDWMAEMSLDPGKLADETAKGTSAPQGVPVQTRAAGDTSKGQAVESKRGQR
jgi:hypothetical protein